MPMLSPLTAIVASGLMMAVIALVGSVTLLLRKETLDRMVRPLVAFAAGSLLGGAFFHMLPAASEMGLSSSASAGWVMTGFTVFLALEQLLHWHHCLQAAEDAKEPLTYLILLGDGLHNFVGGLGVGAVMLLDVRLGFAAWLAAAAHEIPQELGDFGVLIHGGWNRRQALLLNLLSGLTFLVGGLVAYGVSAKIDVTLLVAFAAGNFIYIGASDLVPEVNRHDSLAANVVHFSAFLGGVTVLWAMRIVLSGLE